MSIQSSRILGLAIVTIIGVGVLSPTQSKAYDGIQFDIGKTNFCIGISCLHRKKPIGGRNSKNVKDHRGNTRDHRPERKNEVVVIKPDVVVRDHRTKVRDHRKNARFHQTKVRDHRTNIRDHR